MRWPEDRDLRRRMVEGLLDWVEGLEVSEPLPAGVDPALDGPVPDLVSALAGLTSLTGEVGVQGRELRRLAEAVREAAERPDPEVRPSPEEERGAGRREVIAGLLEARDRAARVLGVAGAVEPRLVRGRFGAARRREAFASLLASLRMHLEALDEALRGLDCREIPADGRPFDPSRMRAVEAASPAEGEPGTVVEVVRPGWLLGEEVLRPAEVRAVPGTPAEGSG